MGTNGDGALRGLFGGTLYYLDATFELSCIEATWGLCTKLTMTASSKESRAIQQNILLEPSISYIFAAMSDQHTEERAKQGAIHSLRTWGGLHSNSAVFWWFGCSFTKIL